MTAPQGLDGWNPSTAQRRVRDGVAAVFKVPPHALIGRSRRKPLVEYRQVAMWTIRECFPALSYPMIGRLMGGRDHSTVIYGCRQVEARRARDPGFAELTDALRDGFGVQRAGIEMDAALRLRIAAVCALVAGRRDAAVEEEGGEPAAVPPAPMPSAEHYRDRNRFFAPKDFTSDRAAPAMIAAGSRDLLAALRREGFAR